MCAGSMSSCPKSNEQQRKNLDRPDPNFWRVSAGFSLGSMETFQIHGKYILFRQALCRLSALSKNLQDRITIFTTIELHVSLLHAPTTREYNY